MDRECEGTHSHPEWMKPILEFMDQKQQYMSLGVYGLAKKVLRMVESEADIPEPFMWTGSRESFHLKWELGSGSVLLLVFVNSTEFRARYTSHDFDSGVAIVDGNYADNIRCIFRRPFGTNNVTRQAMEYHLGRKHQ